MFSLFFENIQKIIISLFIYKKKNTKIIRLNGAKAKARDDTCNYLLSTIEFFSIFRRTGAFQLQDISRIMNLT